MRCLIEGEMYAHMLKNLGQIERLDDALMGVTWAISMMPEEYPPILSVGAGFLRVAKSEKLKREGSQVQLRIWFAIRDEHHVELLGIDAVACPA